jgi:hypothetical protein
VETPLPVEAAVIRSVDWEIRNVTQGNDCLITLLCLLSALNAIALVANMSPPSRAEVGVMSYEECAIKILHVRSSRSHNNAGLMSISLS